MREGGREGGREGEKREGGRKKIEGGRERLKERVGKSLGEGGREEGKKGDEELEKKHLPTCIPAKRVAK